MALVASGRQVASGHQVASDSQVASGRQRSPTDKLSELSDVGLLSELSDCRNCRTDGRQWKTEDERGTMSESLLDTVGHCRTVGLSDLSGCRTTVGLLSDYCRITVGIYCRTVGPGLRSNNSSFPRTQRPSNPPSHPAPPSYLHPNALQTQHRITNRALSSKDHLGYCN
eukprot:5287779-Prymnesium_polylepis.1